MSRVTLSLIIRCSCDAEADVTRVRIERVDNGASARLREGSFLVRCTLNERTEVQRCLIRHIASGREAYVQIGPGLRDFIKDCLLDTNGTTGHA